MKSLINEDRVRRQTVSGINERIDREIEREALSYSGQSVEAISQKITDLNKEWDMERTLETNASILALTGVCFGFFLNRKWLFLPMAVLGFLLQHAIEGWCPPVPVFRRLGVRTRQEIDQEIYALKGLRGDFDNIPDEKPATTRKAQVILESVKKGS